MRLSVVVIFLFGSIITNAQFTQNIRGTVMDQVLQKPLAGATVYLTGINTSVISDSNGVFRFVNVPVGVHSLEATYVGYKNGVANNIYVITGKEQVVVINMEPSVSDEQNVFVKGINKRNRPLNEMSLVSSRAFTVEETQKYAAAVNDPARMATSFAGVLTTDDGSNLIAIRGNSPTGLQWRMEGMEIPNPNHFADQGSSGGGISILSAALLSNSDFMTGAFAAEYGNALSGVFDLKLRKGNNEKREYTLQAGVLGLNVAAEGPFKKGGKSSYLINYRYSTLSLLDKLGVNVGEGTSDFQDLSYNIYLPTKKAGTFTLFGFGGKSLSEQEAEKDSSKWEGEDDRYGSGFRSNTYFTGATHQINLGSKTMLRSTAGWSKAGTEVVANYEEDNGQQLMVYEENNYTSKITASSTVNHRFNNRNMLRAGMIVSFLDFDYYQKERANPNAPVTTTLDASGNTQTIQAFAQWQGRPTEKLTLNAGLHYLTLLLNNSTAIEPRASIRYNISRTANLSFGYGMHSQMQSMGIYFGQQPGLPAQQLPNKNLDFTQSQHYVLSYSQQLSANLRLKTELYYQNLSNIPVGNSDTSTFATVNMMEGFVTDELVNKGKGKNYGLEISLERYLSNNLYFMFNNSLYQSKYTTLDGIERNTRFNGRFASNLVAGKDFVSKDGRRTIGLNIKMIYAGGFRITPVNLEASKDQGYTIYYDKQAYQDQLPGYFRTDLRFSIAWNRKHATTTLSLDLQNATNRQNIYGYFYDATKQAMVTGYQTGIIPVLNYKIEF
ncbi:MAG TPA: TonB-dependent receptor [Phnomibacter sp.]|nr:TonB-dependent receptor [Phnomibacter sp.]